MNQNENKTNPAQPMIESIWTNHKTKIKPTQDYSNKKDVRQNKQQKGQPKIATSQSRCHRESPIILFMIIVYFFNFFGKKSYKGNMK
jgi:hypothetical protein